MRVKIEGIVSEQRIQEVLLDLLARVPDAQFSGTNLYFTLRDSEGHALEFVRSDGTPLEVLVYREERIQTPIESKGRKPKLRIVKNESSAA